MKKNNEIFICYRRVGGKDVARLVRSDLERKGFSVFLDVDDLRSGPFNTALYRRIDSCSDVVAILTQGSLDRCHEEGDWMRQEIARALRVGTNIVPVMAHGFQWPSQPLPPDVEGIRIWNGVPLSHDFFDASMTRVVGMLKAQPGGIVSKLLNQFKVGVRRQNAGGLSQEELDSLFIQAVQHRDRLEAIEANEIMERITRDYPNYLHKGWECSPAEILAQEMPDYRRSILLVVGCSPIAQIHDGTQANWLKEEINSRGRKQKREVAYVVSDRGLAEDTLYQKCAQIAIGGPVANSLTAKLRDRLKTDVVISEKGALIQQDIGGAARQVCLWGTTSEQTANAVKLFVTSGLLERFLKMIWSR